MPETVQTSGVATVSGFGPEQLAALYKSMGVQRHPILTLPTLDQVRPFIATDDGKAQFIQHLQRRQDRIDLASKDPLNWTFEAETWAAADRVLLEHIDTRPQPPEPVYMLGIFGGNRAQKTWYAIKRAVECALLFQGPPESPTKIAVCSESIDASVATVQSLTWHYIRKHYEHLNHKRSQVTAISHTQKNGFADGKLIFPNGSEIHFLTYNQEAGDYEGWEFGAPVAVYQARIEQLKAALADESGAKDAEFAPINLAAWRAQGRKDIPNIGAVCDESMPMSWLKMFSRRAKFRRAKLLWPFTPVKGITPAIKEMVGVGKTLEHRPSELLPGQNLPELPAGTMPFIRECAMTGARAIYFFSMFNKFGPSAERTYYDEIKTLCAGKVNEYVERVAYGYARDSVSRAFPNFGQHNIVKPEKIPANGTNYLMFDPHGTRNFPMIWFRIVPERPNSIYIYREWPDVPTYGEWAVPTEREVNDTQRKGWDGDPGPAQAGLGWGVVHYKLEIRKQEAVRPPRAILEAGNRVFTEEELDALLATVKSPYHRKRIRQALRSGEPLNELYEVIAARFGDPRGIHNSHVSEQGGTTLYDDFEKENVDERTGQVVPPMELWDAPTSRRANAEEVDEGITKVNELLGCPGREAMPVFNQPHLFVSEECQQVIWMLGNYTGRGGGTGACKDFADLVKYACLADCEHIEETQRPGRKGKGW